jgi:hypothetical protein
MSRQVATHPAARATAPGGASSIQHFRLAEHFEIAPLEFVDHKDGGGRECSGQHHDR